MDGEAILLQVRDGELVGVGDWVYVWLRPGQERPVVYIGSTRVPPVVRTWLHLHDEDPDVGRLLARYPGATNEELDVLAFPVLPPLQRSAVKSALIGRLELGGLLSAEYVGDQGGLLNRPGNVEPTVDWMFAQIVAHNGQAGSAEQPQ